MSSGFSPLDSVNAQIWRVVALFDELPSAPRVGHRLDELSASFARLAVDNQRQRVQAENQIWSIWCDHSDASAKASMIEGIGHLSGGALVEAEAVFDELIEQYPQWAEAWNKRATVLFLQDRDALSVMDIYTTLSLEPRHFGALGGFAQIAVRNDEREAARESLSRVLAVNPRAPGVAEAIAGLDNDGPSVLH